MKVLMLKRTARYLISAAGIIIGLAAAMVIFGIAEGGTSVLNDSFWRNGVKVYDVELKDRGLDSQEYLLKEDVRLLTDKMPEVEGSIPVLSLEAQLKSYKAAVSARTFAVNEKYQQYANLEMLKGSFINEQDVRHASKIAAIDELTALELYGTTDIIGQKLDLQVNGKKVEFIIAGVFRNFNKNIETMFDDKIPGMCFIPDSVPEDVSFEYSVEKLVALVKDNLHKEEAAAKLSHLLEKEHGVVGMYDINEYKQLPEVAEFTDKYLVFAVIIAIVGLISGGIGVMYAMLLNIQERKKEIGLYKFYGSGIKELQYDIVYRTLVICHSCGALGLILGILTGSFIGSFINIRARFTLLSIFITIAASVLVGIISSLYPASRIKQVDASEAIWGE
ncbi:MAG TPA: ABC transporter permease [Clostridia bacterium]|nr:ABC transporter permease [Clostridia bacterium]